MADSPKIDKFLMDLWDDWREEIQARTQELEVLAGGDVDVVGDFKTELQNRADAYQDRHPPTNSSQAQFWDRIKERIDQVETEGPFKSTLDRIGEAQREQVQQAERAQIEAERIQKELKQAETRLIEGARDQGFVVRQVPGAVQIGSTITTGTPRGEEASAVERLRADSYLEQAKERLQGLRGTSKDIRDELKSEYPLLSSQIDRLAIDIQRETDVRALNLEIPTRIASLPYDARRGMVRLVKIRTEQLLGTRQPVRRR